MTVVLGPIDCSSCHRLVVWDRVGTYYRLMERNPRFLRTHSCRRKPIRSGPVCSAWMPLAGESCARVKGHRDNHRSRYDLDNQARTFREGWRV